VEEESSRGGFRVHNEVVSFNLIRTTRLKGGDSLVLSGFQWRTLDEVVSSLGVGDPLHGAVTEAIGDSGETVILAAPDASQLNSSLRATLAISGGFHIGDASMPDLGMILPQVSGKGPVILTTNGSDAVELLLSLRDRKFPIGAPQLKTILCQVFVPKVCSE